MSLKLYSWNVNGLRAIYKKGFIEWFLTTNPDILCLQETKLQPDQIPPELTNIPGYTPYFNSAERKGYSGVAVYTKEIPLKVETGMGIARFDIEGRILTLFYKDFILMNVYFPNGQLSPDRLKFKLEFYDAFYEYVMQYHQKGENIVICGDVNTAHNEIDLARPHEWEGISVFLPEERAWIDKLLKAGFYDTFRLFTREGGHYSWWSPFRKERERNIGIRIDYFFVNQPLLPRVVSAKIHPEVMGSDHCPISLELN